jgi:hypothetical protein
MDFITIPDMLGAGFYLPKPIPNRLEGTMKTSIGGLFKKRKQAEHANKALQEAGFKSDEITMLVHKKKVPLNYEHRVSAQELGISAAIGAAVVGFIAAILGLLIARGVVIIPGFNPDLTSGPYLEIITFALFLVQGAITGAILGVAIRLFTSRENAKITPTGIKRGGVLVVVNADDTQKEIAERVLRESDALDVENLTEKWDPNVWADFREIQPSVSS